MTAASIYVRLSRAANDENLSRDGMVADCRSLADRLGYDVYAVHVDDGISGAIRDRPEFTAWLQDAVSGRVDALLTYHADRLTREGINAAAMVLDVVEGKNPHTGKVERPPVRLVDVDGLDSVQGDAFRWRFVVAAEVARSERERIVKRNQARADRMRAEGRWMGGAVPYGCAATTDDKGHRALTADPKEAAVLREAAHRVLRGDNLHSVMLWMNAEGHRTRRGLRWSRTALRQTLTSESTAKHVLTSAEARAVREACAPKRARADRDPRPGVALLKGLIICPACGHTLNTTGKPRAYRCLASNTGCTDGRSMLGERVDEYVTAEFLARFGPFAAYEERVTLPNADMLDAAEAEAHEAEAALAVDLSPEVIERVRVAREALAEAQAAPVERRIEVVPSGRTFGEEFEAADLVNKRRLLQGVLKGPIVLGVYKDEKTGRRLTPGERLTIPWRGEPEVVDGVEVYDEADVFDPAWMDD